MRGKESFLNLGLNGETVLILGSGESGLAAAALAKKIGARAAFDTDTAESRINAGGAKFAEVPALAVISPGIPPASERAAAARGRGIPVISELEFAYRVYAARFPRANNITAVTGTNGKTTTVSLLTAMLGAAGAPAEALGNIGAAFSRRAAEIPAGVRAVLEVSSFQAETADAFRPHIGALLNITPDHLDRHGTFSEYAACKMKIFSRQTPSDFAVLNADDAEVMARAADVPSDKFYFSARKKVRGCYEEGGGLYFWDGASDAVRIAERADARLPGAHNRLNALAALTAFILSFADVAGNVSRSIKTKGGEIPVNRGKIAAAVCALRAFPGVKHRIEFVREHRGVSYYNDSKGTNIDCALKAAAAVDGRVALILGGSDKGYEFDELFRALPPNAAWAAVTGATADKIMAAAGRCGFKNVVKTETLRGAVYAARDMVTAAGGGAVILSPACASFDKFRDYAERGEVFRSIVRRMK